MWFNEPEQWKRARQTRQFLCWFPAFMLLAVVTEFIQPPLVLLSTSIRLMQQRRVIDIEIKSLWRHFSLKPTDACFSNKSHRTLRNRQPKHETLSNAHRKSISSVSYVGKIIFSEVESNKTSPNSHKFIFRINLKAEAERVLFSGKLKLFFDIELLSEFVVN